jgi:TetR/AcrR family transcriptional regulator
MRRGRPTGGDRSTRERLLDAGRQLLSERGSSAVTVREIARRAGVHPALLHYYFETKAGLFAALVERVHERLGLALQTLPAAGLASERLEQWLRTCADVVAEDPYVCRLLLQEILQPDDQTSLARGIRELISAQLRDIVQTGVNTGEFAAASLAVSLAEVAPQLIGFLLLAPLGSGASSAARMRAWAPQAARLVLYGLQGPRGASA